jgi:polar amino acid transport system ATP-binding protein
MTMILVSQLVKHHGPLCVLDGIDMTVARGEVAAILGPSGGGKSTFLRCLNGLDRFDGGRVSIDGLCLEAGAAEALRESLLREVRQRVGMVFQQFNLFPHRTVLENVMEAPLCVSRRPRAEVEALSEALLARVGLADKLTARPRQLSGGQQQRVAIARALAMRPDIILFDEPTSALDPRMTAEVLEVMADLARGGQTMIVVTHAMAFARQVAHTVHVFGQGRVIESGPPCQIFDDPQCEATRQFLAQVRAA